MVSIFVDKYGQDCRWQEEGKDQHDYEIDRDEERRETGEPPPLHGNRREGEVGVEEEQVVRELDQ